MGYSTVNAEDLKQKAVMMDMLAENRKLSGGLPSRR